MLKVWLPLDGDLRNLGASDLQFTNENATNIAIDNNGKIGKCYKRSAVKTAGRIIADKPLNLNEDLSICCWAKVITTVGDTANGLVSLHSHANNTGFGITVKQVSTTDYRISCSTGNSSSRTFCSYYGTTNIKDTWHHLTLTYNNTLKQFKLWVDGNLEYTQSYTNASRDETLMLFEWSTTYNSVDYRPACSLNDVRIYDHCLSAAEVREIARGLVLHYKLDGTNVKSGTNLVTSVSSGGQTSVLTDGRIGVKTSGTNADTYFAINLSESITNGTTYKLTCNASGITAGKYWNFPLGAQNNSTLPFKIYNGYNEYTFTANNINWGSNRLFMDDITREDWANPATFWDFQLYKLSNTTMEVKDSSGYGHNGTIIGNTSINSSTPRFQNSFKLLADGITNYQYSGAAYIVSEFGLTTPKQMTIAFWAYPENGYGGSANHASFCTTSSTYPTDYNTTAFNHRDGSFDINYSSTASNAIRLTFPYSLGAWNHYAITYDGQTAKAYKNGVLTNSTAFSSAHDLMSFTKIFIGLSAAGGAYRKTIGSYSDFRIYCTPLLDNDIKMLYNVGMKVDNLGEIHSFEFKEAGGRELLGGVPLTTSYSNHENIYTNYTNGEIKLTGSSSISTPYIEISPTGKTYYWDAIITKDASNVFYLGFERYDANKTARSNNATTYVIGGDSTAWTKKHVFGTVNLSTDGVNACKYITLRILNDWSSANNRTAIIHQLSLREISTVQKQSLNKNGILLLDELKEDSKAAFYKNGFIESTEFIEI